MSDIEDLLGRLADEGDARGANAVFDAASTDAERRLTRRRRRGSAVLAVMLAMALIVGGVVVARGRGSSDTLPKGAGVLSVVVSATRGSDSLRFETVMESANSDPHDKSPTQTITGEIDFANHLGTETTSYDETGLPPEQSKFLGPEEIRWLGNRSYQHLDAATAKFEYGAPPGESWIETHLSASAVTSTCFEYSDPLSAALGVSSRSLSPGDPVELLDKLRAAGATLVRIGTGSVRGTQTTHWGVNTTGVTTTTLPANCSPSLLGVEQGAPRIEIWTDAQNRVRRIMFTTKTTITPPKQSILGSKGFTLPAGGSSSSVGTTTIDLFDFGVHVSVSAPPADQVYDATAGLAGYLRGPGTVAGSAWRDVAHGTFRHKRWTVWYARSSTGWRCYETQGVPTDQAPPELSVGDGMPTRDGRPADCSPVPGGVFENGPFTAMLGGIDGKRAVLVGRVDDSASEARLIFADGSSTSLTIDPATRLVQWTGPVSPAPEKLESGNDTCVFDDSSNDNCQGADLNFATNVIQLPPGVPLPSPTDLLLKP